MAVARASPHRHPARGQRSLSRMHSGVCQLKQLDEECTYAIDQTGQGMRIAVFLLRNQALAPDHNVGSERRRLCALERSVKDKDCTGTSC